MMNHEKTAKEIKQFITDDNIVSAEHCATRLRLSLRDYSIVDKEALSKVDGVKGVFKSNNQLQIVVGAGDVDKVYNAFMGSVSSDLDVARAQGEKQHRSPKDMLLAGIQVLSDIFVPIIPALVAGGLMMAINNVLTAEGLFGATALVDRFSQLVDIADMLNLLASAPFAFLPILLGFSATKRFGGNPYLGAAIGMAMVMPQLVNGYDVANAIADGSMTYWNIFGLEISQAGYQGSVLPVLVVAFVLAKLENFFHKIMPNALDFILSPLLAIIISGFLTFSVIGPVMQWVGNGINTGLVWAYTTFGAVGVGILGLFYSPIVITGLHQSFPAIETSLLSNIAQTGGSFIFPVAAMANVAQGGATLAMSLLQRDKEAKSVSLSAGISALLGITEPAIFGVNLRHKFPFFIAMVASGIASVFIGYFHVLAIALGSAGVIGFISIAPQSIVAFLFGVVISLLISFIATYAYGYMHMRKTKGETVSDDAKAMTVSAPVAGDVIPLKDVNDEVFSNELVGKGMAIRPSDGTIYAPVDGTVEVTYASNHAFGFKSDSGIEVLIHIGLETVDMNGEGFKAFCEQGDRVKRNDKICEFDRDLIKSKGYDDTVMVVITNTDTFADVTSDKAGEITVSEDLLKVE